MNRVDLLKKSCNFALGAVHDDLMIAFVKEMEINKIEKN